MPRLARYSVVLAALLFTTAALADTYTIEQYLNIRRATGGSWSPDGKTIAYLYNETGVDQVYSVPAGGGTPKRLTDYTERVSFVEYSPVADRLVFGMDEGGDERTQLYLITAGGAPRPLTAKPKVIHEFGGWSHDGKYIAYSKNERNEAFFDVYVMNVDTGKEHLVFQQDGYNEVASWSWDDRYLVISNWESNYNNNLYLVELKGLKDRLLTPHQGWATYTDIAWPLKSKDFYLISNLSQDWSKLARFRLKKDLLDYLDAARWNAEGLQVSRDGKRIAYLLNLDGYSKSFLIDLDEQKTFGNIPMGDGVINHIRFSPDGSQLLFNYSSPTKPYDLWLYDVAAQSVHQLTVSDTAGIPRESFIEPEFLRLPGYGDFSVPAYLYLPKDMPKDGSNAAVVYAHGGPESQERPDFAGIFQYFLNNGIAILAPNVRGSEGYGKTYLHLDDKRNRLDSLRDYAFSAEYLKKTGYFDEKRIGILGGSYGGWVVLASLTDFPNLWAAGVSIVGIANFETFLEKTGPWRRALREAEYGELDTDREYLRSISPVHKTDQINAPLMLIQGANDPRVPASEAEQMAEAMRAGGRPVEYLLYPDEGHGLTKLKNRLDAYPKMAEFLKKYLFPSPPPPTREPDPIPEPKTKKHGKKK